MTTKFILLIAAAVAALSISHPGAAASYEHDREELETTLLTFLAGTEHRAVHDRFWADDLVYTSSAGARYGKAEILAGFDDGSNSARMRQDYGAEDIRIRVMGDIAVVTFRLTADRDGERVGDYFNTGVFRRAGDGWRAFTWQATRIPESS